MEHLTVRTSMCLYEKFNLMIKRSHLICALPFFYHHRRLPVDHNYLLQCLFLVSFLVSRPAGMYETVTYRDTRNLLSDLRGSETREEKHYSLTLLKL